MSKTDHYRVALTTSAAYDPDAKKAFHRTAKTLLRQLAKKLDEHTGKGYGEHDPIRSNMGGIAVSGEITLHYDRLYVQVSQSAFGRGETDILFRSCEGRKDFTGGQNHFAPIHMLLDPDQLAREIETKCTFRMDMGESVIK